MKTNTPADSEIIYLLAEESTRREAFELIIRKYQSRIYWHVRKMVLSHDDADDLLQEIFIKIWQNLHSFRGDSSLFTWLYRIATNETLTFLKKRDKAKTMSFDDSGFNWESYLDNDPLFDGEAIERKLYASMAKLPDKQRQVFQLKYFEEMKYEEMAAILNVSVGALKASYHHAVKKIESFFASD